MPERVLFHLLGQAADLRRQRIVRGLELRQGLLRGLELGLEGG